MLLDIKPLHSRGACLQDLIATASGHRNLSNELMYSEAWGFSFRLPEPDAAYIIGYGLEPDYETCLHDLDRYQGIEVLSQKAESSAAVLTHIEKNLQDGTPVIIYLDSFWTTYLGSSRVNHHDHYVLVVGIDREANVLYCVDPPVSKKTELLPITDFLEGNDGTFASFRFHSNIQEFDAIAWTSRLRDKLWPSGRENIFDAIHRFADAIADDKFDMRAEVALSAGEGIWMSPLVWGLINVSSGRKSIGIAASYIGERFAQPRFKQLSNQLEAAAQEWDSIRASLLKLNYMKVIPKGFKEKIVDQLRQLAEDERSMAAALIKDILGENVSESDEERVMSMPLSYELIPAAQSDVLDDWLRLKALPVQLAEWCNNNGVGYLRSSASLTCMDDSEHFLLEEGQEGRFWSDEAFREFLMNEPSRGKDDNVSCFGQRIEFEPDFYAGAVFIGCSEWGSFEETLTIHYQDGSSQQASIAFTDWQAETPAYGERIIWQGRTARYFRTNDYFGEGRKLYQRALVFEPRKKVSSIELPICPNIHLFACNLYLSE
ncbi:butirosin biosynthesis protein H-like [Paenibacillus cellulosilyticus]|uniref:Butirosin biosynthesis protein H-like n=1 Tax=Paenibacillus cellulosilyticus TaxID=375489 RepID=A0A2V2Z3R6_9BACL|nr:butirosin biosynthesis protein H-like [Paenibacillus cellulosilyticus]